MPWATLLSVALHCGALYSVENPAFQHVTQASVSSWLQEQTADVSRSLCRLVPILSSLLLPRINPVSLVGSLVAAITMLAYIAMESQATVGGTEMDTFPDTVAAVLVSMMLFSTMMPMAVYWSVFFTFNELIYLFDPNLPVRATTFT